MAQSGYVYVLANPSINGIVKIGKTRQNPDGRAKALPSASGVHTPFVVVYHSYFDDYSQAERYIHFKLDNFKVSNNREFFQVSIPTAIDIIIEAKGRFGGFLSNPNSAIEDKNNSEDSETIIFGTIQEPEKELYQLLDVFISHSMRGWNNFVKSTGLSIPQFGILMQLHYRGAFSVSEVSNHFGISVPAASQLVEKLVQAGYLERAEDPNDRRARLLPLSTKGKKLIEQGFKRRYRWMDTIMNNLSLEERTKVVDGLMILSKAAQKVEQE